MNQPRANAILPFDNYGAADFTGKEGFPAYIDGPTNTIRLCESTGDWPTGVILRGGAVGEKSSFAVSIGGLAGTVRVKLGADVSQPGLPLQVVQDGTDYVAGPDAGSGARVVFAYSLESGVSGEMIEAILRAPDAYTS